MFKIQCVEHLGHLDGGPRHMRKYSEGQANPEWITWRLIPAGNNAFLIQNVANGGFLDGGPKHIRPFSDGIINRNWITWRLKPSHNGDLFIQCEQNNGNYRILKFICI